MKRYYFMTALAVLALTACNKEELPSSQNGNEIVLNVMDDGLNMTVETKASAITTVPSSLYWSATTGTAGSAEVSKWGSASATVSSNKIATGKYQTATPTAYNYYVANQAITFGAGGSTISASNTTDVVAGSVASSVAVSPSVALDHIFARTGTLTGAAPDGYTLSNISWSIVQSSTTNVTGTAGTYNLATKTWTAASTRLATATALTSSSDMYLIPGTYNVSVTYTLTKGDWSKSTTKTGTVTLTGGKVNNIKVSSAAGDGKLPVIDGGASDINISVTLNAWGTNTATLTL